MKYIVMISGWAMPASVFEPLKKIFAADYQVMLIDLPGVGVQPALSGPTSLVAYADAVLALAPEQAIWLGWSLGGLVAKYIAINHPARVQKLVTVASSPCFIADESSQWPGVPAAVFAQFRNQLENDVTDTLLRFIDLQFYTASQSRFHADARAIKALIRSAATPQPAALQNGLTILCTSDLRAQLATLTQPWLAVFGRLDAIVPVAVADTLKTTVTTVIPGAAHMPFVTHLEEFMRTVQPFIEEYHD